MIDGGYKKFDQGQGYNKFNPNPMQTGYMNAGQQPNTGGYQGGYQKNFNAAQGQDGFKPRGAFVKPDFNGNPRMNQQFGDKPPFQNKYMGNKPRAPFSGPNRFNEFGGPQQKFNKFENYKGGYGQGGAETGETDEFQGANQYNNQSARYTGGNNRFVEHQNAAGTEATPNGHAQQPFVQPDSIDGTQYDSNIMPGYRMIPKMYDANGGQLPFPQAFDFQGGPPQTNGQIADIHPNNPCGFQSMNGPPQGRGGMYVIGAAPPNPAFIQYQHTAVQP